MRQVKLWSGRTARWTALGFLLAGLTSTANAGFVASGTASFSPDPTVTVDYAVYQTGSGGDWATHFGFTPTMATLTDSGPPITTSAFVYLYEVVNPSTSIPLFENLQVSGLLPDFSSWGIVAGEVFSTVSSVPTAPDATFMAGAGLDAHSAFKQPLNSVPGNGTNVHPLAFSSFGSGSGISPGHNSTLLFITSDYGPQFFISAAHNGGTSYAELPAPAPVPATLALLLSGVPGFAGIGLIFRRRQKAAV